MSQFDAAALLNTQVSGEMATEFEPVPEGEWPAVISKVDGRLVGKDSDRPVLDVTWKVQSPEVAAQLGIEEPQVRQTIFLDISPSGGLDLGKGKNVQLGRLRAAVGQNGPGAWAPGLLVGSVATIRVSHREYEGRIYAEVKGVAASS